jgi:CheY-like chemotaxis protein
MTQKRVLVVDDDRDLTELMEIVLSTAGFDVTTACHGAAGLAALEREPDCVVVLDLMMPGIDGFEFRDRQRRQPVACDAPVLVVSAHHDIATLAERMGVNGFLRKPFSPEDLVDAVARVAATGTA